MSSLQIKLVTTIASLGLASASVLLVSGVAVAEHGSVMDAEAIHRVTQEWQNRVFVVVADGGPARVPVEEILANPKSLLRKRRVGCAVFLGEGQYLLTSASVTAGQTEVEIFDGHGRHVLARVVGADPFLDLALLEAMENLPDLAPLTALEFQEEPTRGLPCLVLGNAYGHSLSATLGKFGGTIEIQPGGVPTRAHRVAALIYPGDSGAPVVDAEGRFVGIVTGVSKPQRRPLREETGSDFSASEEPAGNIGFAIPSRECRRAWMDLRDFGRVRRGFLGVRIAAGDEGNGVLVLNVNPGGPAAVAGVKPGDLITKFGQLFVREARQLCAFVASEEPYRVVKTRIVRNGREHVLSVQIGVAQALPHIARVPREDLEFPVGSRRSVTHVGQETPTPR